MSWPKNYLGTDVEKPACMHALHACMHCMREFLPKNIGNNCRKQRFYVQNLFYLMRVESFDPKLNYLLQLTLKHIQIQKLLLELLTCIVFVELHIPHFSGNFLSFKFLDAGIYCLFPCLHIMG